MFFCEFYFSYRLHVITEFLITIFSKYVSTKIKTRILNGNNKKNVCVCECEIKF